MKTLNDWYSANLTSYDSKIEHKIGLISLAELIHAGGIIGTISDYYLSDGSYIIVKNKKEYQMYVWYSFCFPKV